MAFEPKKACTLIFVRHGQYSKSPERLTAMGRRQALLAGKVLQGRGARKLYCSTMPRARETAKAIASVLGLQVQAKEFFCEGILPGLKGADKIKVSANKKRADRAYNFLFKKAQRKDCFVIVAHGNVIRYWMCKALGISTKKWLSMDILQGSLTTFRIDARGNIMLLGFSECSHIPLKWQTYL